MTEFIHCTDKEGKLCIRRDAIYAFGAPGAGTRDSTPWCKTMIWTTGDTFYVKDTLPEVLDLLDQPQ